MKYIKLLINGFFLFLVSVSVFLILIYSSSAQNKKNVKGPSQSRPDAISLITKFNEKAYDFLNKELDSSRYYSQSALNLSRAIKSDYDIAFSMINLAFSYFVKKEYKTGNDYFQKSIDLFQNKKDKSGEAFVYNKIGTNYKKINDEILALYYYNKSLNIYQQLNDYKRVAEILIGKIAELYLDNGTYPKAFEALFRALKISEDNKDNIGIADACNNLGLAYYNQDDIENANRFIQRSMDLNKTLGRTLQIAKCFTNLGVYYANKDNVDSALKNYLEALRLYNQIGEKPKSTVYLNIGILYQQLKKYDTAYIYFSEALALSREKDTKNEILVALIYIGHYYFELENYTLAKENFLEGVEIAKEINDNYWLNQGYSVLAQVSDEMNDYKSAYQYHLLYSEMQDSLFNQEKSKAIGKIEWKYDQDKKDTIAYQKSQIIMIFLVSFIVGFVLLLILAFFIYRNYRNKKVANVELSGKNKIISTANIRLTELNEQVSNQLDELNVLNDDLVQMNSIISSEQAKSEKLLLNLLPASIAGRLKEGETTIADNFAEASVMFIDIAEFTKFSSGVSPQYIVNELNKIFTAFDKIASKYKIEKIKTIGDCYMAVAGIPEPRKDHALAIANMALDAIATMINYKTEDGAEIKFRIGIDCGPVVAGVIGEQKFIYDLWGDTVNTASRMEDYGVVDMIQVTERFKNVVEKLNTKTDIQNLKFIERGKIDIKGKGKMNTYFLISG